MEKREHPTSVSVHGGGPHPRPSSRAILLSFEGMLSPNERNLTALLDFFGIPWNAVSLGELPGECGSAEGVRAGGFCILSSAACIAAAPQTIEGADMVLPAWMLNASSLYIYDFQDTTPCRNLLRSLTDEPAGEIRKPAAPEARLSVTNDFPEMCGPMSGISAPVKANEKDAYFALRKRAESWQSIVTANHGESFISAIRGGVQFFLNACSDIVEINAPAAKYFDVKENFCNSVPLVMYLKWAFADICWTGVETRGCLIVDDPLLKPRYGFMRFSDTLELMDSHNFTTTIAFIPWNWRRTNRQTIRQFQQRSDRLSLCIHGCDHTGGEFAARSSALLNKRIKTAAQRMELLLEKTSLQHDHVMVFPQGSFSPEAGRALKLNGFVAAVNTEVAPSGGAQNETVVADLWNVAIMKYGTFPIFTRRYLTHGIENFAFDALLGKPCLVVAHHDVFKAGGHDLMEFIEQLNSLNRTLRWCSLGDVVKHSFRMRNCVGGAQGIQMYAEELVAENLSPEPREFVVMREERDPDCVKAVIVNQQAVDHTFEENHLRFRVTVPAGARIEVRVLYLDNLEVDSRTDSIAYTIKTRVRRHLSEFRDNYVSRNDLLYATGARVKRLLN
jgi:hypothetical protein